MPYIPTASFERLTDYADQSDPELVIPEDLTTLSDEELGALHAQAVSNFDAIYGDGGSLSSDDVTTLSALTEAIETLQAEHATREQAAAERSSAAAELAARVRTELSTQPAEEDAPVEEDDEQPVEEDEEPVEEESAESVTASGRKEIRVNLSGVRSRQRPSVVTDSPKRMSDVMRVADVPGFASGDGLDWDGVGRAVDRRLAGFNPGQYAAAASSNRHLREQMSVAVIRKPFAEELTLRNSDPLHVEQVIRKAVDEKRLPGGSLVASGGWCAPSETIYDLFEIESRDGLFSLPEINVTRGGINFTTGPDFASIFAPPLSEFHYTEADDIAGDYDGNGGGAKPCYKVDCPDFAEQRLELVGLCITAGLLQQRGYPEMIARTVRGALIAHDHKLAARVLAAIQTGSTAVTMDADLGAAAPLLTAIELQVEHYRTVHRLARGTTLEAVFPFWVRGVIRADLSKRTGVELLSVTDAQIDGWFSMRGVSPQFVYNWQDLSGAAGAVKAYPTTVKFLLYSAGTWVRGSSDVITLDTLFDSVNLGTNDYTALFTEEGFLVAKLGHDSRVITVPVAATGATFAAAAVEVAGP